MQLLLFGVLLLLFEFNQTVMILGSESYWKAVVTLFGVNSLYLYSGALVNMPGLATDGGKLTVPLANTACCAAASTAYLLAWSCFSPKQNISSVLAAKSSIDRPV